MNWKFLLPARCAMLSVLPVMRLSMAMTRWPSARSRSERCEPRKPAPPVTTDTGVEEVEVMHLSASQNLRGWATKKSEGRGRKAAISSRNVKAAHPPEGVRGKLRARTTRSVHRDECESARNAKSECRNLR